MPHVIVHMTVSVVQTDLRIFKYLTRLEKINCDIFVIDGERYFCGPKCLQKASSSKNILISKYVAIIAGALKIIKYTFFGLKEIVKIRPNIIHCHDYHPLIAVYLYSKLFETKIIYDAHELESGKINQSIVEKFFVKLIERKTWSKVNHFVSVSQSIIDWYHAEYGIKNSTLIRNISLGRFGRPNIQLISRALFCSRYKISEDEILVVTSGYLTKGRYIEEVIDCVRKNKNESIGIRFIFIGSGPLENLVTQAVLEGLSIIHIPHMEYNHLVDLLTIFDIGLCLISNKALSMEFSLPNRLFDYVEAGLMILSTENSDIKKHVKDFDLGEVICREKINFELIKIVRRMALRKFKKRPIELTWQAESRKIDEMYQQVI